MPSSYRLPIISSRVKGRATSVHEILLFCQGFAAACTWAATSSSSGQAFGGAFFRMCGVVVPTISLNPEIMCVHQAWLYDSIFQVYLLIGGLRKNIWRLEFIIAVHLELLYSNPPQNIFHKVSTKSVYGASITNIKRERILKEQTQISSFKQPFFYYCHLFITCL